MNVSSLREMVIAVAVEVNVLSVEDVEGKTLAGLEGAFSGYVPRKRRNLILT